VYLLEGLAGLGYAKTDILHVAQSKFYDHVPAKAVGLATAWIDRPHPAGGQGATPRAKVEPDARFESLAELVDAHRRELNEGIGL
jgi:2-haloacid dehalogenase